MFLETNNLAALSCYDELKGVKAGTFSNALAHLGQSIETLDFSTAADSCRTLLIEINKGE